MNTYTPADSISEGPVTNLFSILCILIEIISHIHEKGEKQQQHLDGFKFGTFTGRFLNDAAVSMAVKRLNLHHVYLQPPKKDFSMHYGLEADFFLLLPSDPAHAATYKEVEMSRRTRSELSVADLVNSVDTR